MTQEDIAALMRAVSAVLKDQDERLTARIEIAERKLAEPGRDGRDADPQMVRGIVVDEIGKLAPPRDGTDGTNGTDGRDACDLVVQEGIDPNKRYQSGTYAAFRGGLVKAVRTTDPLGQDPGMIGQLGWQVLLNGVFTEEEKQLEEGRTIQRTTVYTDGSRSVHSHKTAIPIYRGVYRAAAKFTTGDVVTYAGSLWHCKASGPTSLPPGKANSPVWTLCVKRGADARRDEAA